MKVKIYYCIIKLVLALEGLNKNNISYKDLKYVNKLLDGKGNIKIADFGFCKILIDKTEKALIVCGIQQYWFSAWNKK